MAPSLFVQGTNVPTRLVAQLDQIRERKVALLTATAGFGKTALVRTWLDVHHELDKRGVNVMVTPETSKGVVDKVRHWNTVTTGDEIIPIFIDNHDKILDKSWLSEMLDLVEAQSRLRLILCGRVRPSVPLAGLAIRGQLLEMGPQDLALTRDEQRELLQHNTPNLTEEMLDQVVEDYRGWPIALELLGNAELTPATMASAHTIIDGYLEEEVIHDVNADDMELLEALCALPEFTPVAATHLAARADAGARLTYLSARGLPVEWLSNNAVRFNPALRSYLRQRLMRDPERSEAVTRRAAQWLQRQGQPEDAIRHAVAAQDATLAAELISAYTVRAMANPTPEVHAFFDELAAIMPNPMSLQLSQIALLVIEQPDSKPVSAVAAIEREYLPFMDDAQKVRFYGIALYVARSVDYQRHTDLVERAVECAKKTMTGEIPRGTGQLQVAVILGEYGAYLSLNGQLAEAEDALQRGIAAARLSGMEWLDGWFVGILAHLHSRLGRATSAVRLAQESIATLERVLKDPSLALDPALFALIQVAVDRGRLEEADSFHAQLKPPLEHSQTGLGPERAVIDAVVKLAHNEPRSAVRVLQDFNRSNPPLTADQRMRLSGWLAQAHLSMGQYADAERALALLEGADQRRTSEWATLVRARLLLAQGKPVSAYELLAPVVGARDGRAQDKTWLHLLMTYGITCTATERNEEALEAFQAAGVLAETLGLNTPNARHTQSASALRPDDLNLTAAERNVLAHLASGDKLNQIAEDLYISPNTLKTHLRRIYRKLGVADRHEAVLRARALGIRSQRG